jgi:hypothetical protein
MRSTLLPFTLVSEIHLLPSLVTSSTMLAWASASCCWLSAAALNRNATNGQNLGRSQVEVLRGPNPGGETSRQIELLIDVFLVSPPPVDS